MAIHNAYANCLLGMYKTKEALENALGHITDNLELYNLHNWYAKKIPQWCEMYPMPIA
jgi:hypothetical protein